MPGLVPGYQRFMSHLKSKTWTTGIGPAKTYGECWSKSNLLEVEYLVNVAGGSANLSLIYGNTLFSSRSISSSGVVTSSKSSNFGDKRWERHFFYGIFRDAGVPQCLSKLLCLLHFIWYKYLIMRSDRLRINHFFGRQRGLHCFRPSMRCLPRKYSPSRSRENPPRPAPAAI